MPQKPLWESLVWSLAFGGNSGRKPVVDSTPGFDREFSAKCLVHFTTQRAAFFSRKVTIYLKRFPQQVSARFFLKNWMSRSHDQDRGFDGIFCRKSVVTFTTE